MTHIAAIAIASLLAGIILFVVAGIRLIANWLLGKQTPVQEAMPIVGAAFFVAGLLLLIVKAAMP